MTISTTTNRVTYTGNGVTVAFSFPYAFFAQADLVVIETIIATGVQTTKALTTHYTIAGSVDALGHYSSGGTVTAVTAPASTVTWTIYRDPTATQTTDLVENDPMPAESIEAALDYQTMLNQRTRDIAARCLQQPEGDSATIDRLPSKVDRASQYLGFDSDGDPIALAAPANTTAVSAFMATVLDDTTAAAARTTLGAVADSSGAMTDRLTITGDASTVLKVPGLFLNTTHATEKRAFIQFQKNGTTKWLLASDYSAVGDNNLVFYDAELTASRLEITSAGVVSLPTGQLKFPGAQNASADVNTLDDYEEGTWTPAVGGNATYTSQVGTYVKIGGQVTVWCTLVINAIGTGSTTVISGLPFAVKAGSITAVGSAYALLSASNVVSLVGVAVSGASTITLGSLTAAAASESFVNAIFANSTSVFVTLTYPAA